MYLPGALPCFEDFGNLPTDLVCADALVDGKPASEVLDMIIIPGGSLVESGSVNKQVTHEILKMAEQRQVCAWVSVRVFRFLRKKPMLDASQQCP